MSMLAQFAFVTMASAFNKGKYELLTTGLLGLALMAVLVSFSRSAWISCGAALTVAVYVHLRLWNQKEVLRPIMIGALGLAILSPWVLSIVIERFVTSGGELLMSRFDQYPVAWNVWSNHFLFGYGVGNYMEALKIYNIPGVIELPVHNVFLWIGAESGLVGVIAFYGIWFTGIRRAWRIVRQGHGPHGRLALALLCGLIAYILDGLTNPLYREPNVYMVFWVLVAITVALDRINKNQVPSATRD